MGHFALRSHLFFGDHPNCRFRKLSRLDRRLPREFTAAADTRWKYSRPFAWARKYFGLCFSKLCRVLFTHTSSISCSCYIVCDWKISDRQKLAMSDFVIGRDFGLCAFSYPSACLRSCFIDSDFNVNSCVASIRSLVDGYRTDALPSSGRSTAG